MSNEDILKRFEGIEQVLLSKRVSAIEQHLNEIEQGQKKEPWWKQTAMVGLLGGLIAATPAITAVIQGYFQAKKANSLQERQQRQVLIEKFIDMSTDSQKPPEARQMILRYLRDDKELPESITKWARVEHDKVTIQIEQLKKNYDAEQKARKIAESNAKQAKERQEITEKQYSNAKNELEKKKKQLKELTDRGTANESELTRALKDKENAEQAVNRANQEKIDAANKAANAEVELKHVKEKMESDLTIVTNQLFTERTRNSDLEEQVRQVNEKLNKLCQTINTKPAECN